MLRTNRPAAETPESAGVERIAACFFGPKDRLMDPQSTSEWEAPSLYQGKENLPEALWSDLAGLKPEEVCRRAGVSYEPSQGYRLPLLGHEYLIEPGERQIDHGGEAPLAGFRAGLVMLTYLARASDEGLSGRMVTERELKGGDLFFQGPHALSKGPVLKRFKRDAAGFLEKARHLWGAAPVDMGDAAFRLLALPKALVYYTLYEEDDEFPARLVVTFDASLDRHLPLDAILALVNLMTERLAK